MKVSETYPVEDADDLFGAHLRKTDTELAKAIQTWAIELKLNALHNLDTLIERDQGSARVEMWQELRSKYIREFSERGAASCP
ncbi:MAG: hypothetical protein NTV58_15065 [Deltaproteobacteria bacterium]|nr:hypothetical protein [Deltaproteobacteria bacterium]